jgi:UDP-N-acetylglucosamine 2-epimerase (non-hydrolysing)
MTLKFLSVVGARPNFMKVAAICEAINGLNAPAAAKVVDHVLVHTGQHYDSNMSDSFFDDLELPRPDICLGVGSASHSVQTARIMERFESVVLNEQPHVVLVVGDVNSTVACALVAKKTWCKGNYKTGDFIPKLAHVEAGLRSFDRTMPEEINRIVTDSISDYLFTTEESANGNLLREGIPEKRIFFVGNVMIDTLMRYRSKARESSILQDLKLKDAGGVKPYALLTLHRPANVDDKQVFTRMLDAFLNISRRMPVIFPAHPRTLKRIQEDGLGDYFIDPLVQGAEALDSEARIRVVPPVGYVNFLKLMSEAKVVLTDSGGIQEETTILGVPCITLRENTERPVTIVHGTNVLVGSSPENIIREFNQVCANGRGTQRAPYHWDGKAAKRIIQILVNNFSQKPAILAPAYESKAKELIQD